MSSCVCTCMCVYVCMPILTTLILLSYGLNAFCTEGYCQKCRKSQLCFNSGTQVYVAFYTSQKGNLKRFYLEEVNRSYLLYI